MTTFTIGDVTITKITELEATGDTELMLPDATPQAVRQVTWLHPHYATEDGLLKTSIHAFAVVTPTRRIIVDTGLGNHKMGRPVPAWNGMTGTFLQDLTDAGFPPDGIDTVLCTHLHVDHAGWDTRLVHGQWVPTFPNARHVFARTEFEHAEAAPGHGTAELFADSVTPLVQAGLVDLVPANEQVTPEIQMVPTPGHTPGHVSILIESRGERALITGDFIHHPVQLARPSWTSAGDHDPGRAATTRRVVLEELARTRTLLIGTHFPGPTAGYVIPDGDDTYRLQSLA
ncbi:MBL fold metallo-hydrolase [Streptomyces sp. SS1-1]|uniref:MBL fold metallo-hydrolase n=1 Tax=Streptomyces sp. SS1-1 TaxID=2651869 RepID=UPI00124FCA12|nr:MBL fold metallo-hydrolase [Streptomyces sp. SS1-1]KAB2977566.1 MBL fold metallo-hydrolase [Streptomyces sp. SS1-1]